MSSKESLEANSDAQESDRSLNEEEITLSLNAPAVYTNRFYMAYGPGGIRITFAEQHGATIAVRSAVIMNPEDGIALYKTMQGMLKEVETALSKIKSLPKEE